MRKLLWFWALSAVFVACDPDIPRSNTGGGNTSFVTALFDPGNSPPIVPTPTSLVTGPNGLLRIPLAPNASAAQQELVGYLNTLDGYPSDTPAKANFDGALDAATVNANNIRVFALGASPAPVPTAAISLAPGGTQVNIAPPTGGWRLGGAYAIAVIGGSNGAKGTAGQPVIGSSTFLLARSRNSLVSNCTQPVIPVGGDFQCNPDCRTTTDVIPSTRTDPTERFTDQSCSAARLESIRTQYAPIFALLEGLGVSRDNVALVWIFRVASRPQLTFDPASQVIPFPNNVVLSVPTDGGRPSVNLPVPNVTLPDGGVPTAVQLYQGLNTLDGFSTTAPIVTQNSAQFGSLNQGEVDPLTVTAATAGVSRVSNLPGGGPAHPPTSPQVKVCVTPSDPTCAPNPLPDGGTPTYRSQIVMIPQLPLDERTTYGAFVTTAVKDTTGKNVIAASPFALARLANPIFDGTHSTVDLISDAQAQQLEPLRAALKPFIDNLAQAVGGRNNIALAWAFTTQSEVSTLRNLRSLPAVIPGISADPLFIQELPLGGRCPGGSCPNVGHFVVGEILVPFLLTGAGGVFNPSAPAAVRISFLLTVPAAAPPVNGYPVTIFGHGITRARTDMINIADRLALNGQAALATDIVWHGERTTCTGSRVALMQPSDDAACADPVAQMCASSGRCIRRNRTTPTACASTANPDQTCLLAGEGMCHTDGRCEAGDYARDPVSTVPLVSGWNILNLTNLFATRDNFRQQVIDLSQVTRVIASTTAATSLNARLITAYGAGMRLDPTKINYAGQSLGGILGTLFTSVSPDVHSVVLNVPGADPVNILLTSPDPAFVLARTNFFASLATQTPPITPGTLEFAQFLSIARWIMDPADPQNMGFSLRNAPAPTDIPVDRRVLIQYITNDQVIPNPTTLELINAAGRAGVGFLAPTICQYNPTTTAVPLTSRHGFLLNFTDPTTTIQAQTAVASFINTGTSACP